MDPLFPGHLFDGDHPGCLAHDGESGDDVEDGNVPAVGVVLHSVAVLATLLVHPVGGATVDPCLLDRRRDSFEEEVVEDDLDMVLSYHNPYGRHMAVDTSHHVVWNR